MRADELARSVETLSSSAAEGQLLARDAAHDRTKATYTRVRARELGETVQHEAEKLTDADAEGEVRTKKAAAIDLADRISTLLGQVQVSPQDERANLRTADRLSALRDRADDLGHSL